MNVTQQRFKKLLKGERRINNRLTAEALNFYDDLR